MLFGNNPQEAMDMALIAQASTLQSRIPFLNIFDGFRTSHELNKVAMIPDEVMTALINPADVSAHRNRALNPEHPFIRGTAQNPDVFFQGREASNLFYQQVPEIVKSTMDKFARLTGRQYHLFEYYGDENAEDIIIIMGSGTGAVSETVDFLNKTGRRTGVLAVKLYRPFSVKDFIHAIPCLLYTSGCCTQCSSWHSNEWIKNISVSA